MAALAAFGAAASAAPPSHAAGFGPVRSLSPATGHVDQLDATVAPTGETAVMWRRLGPRLGKDFAFVVATGPDAEHLGPARPIPAVTGGSFTPNAASLLARPSGGFVACFTGRTGGHDALGCAFTDGSGDFGPLRMVERRPSRALPSYRVAMRADGKLAFVLSHRVGKRYRLRTTTLDADGTVGLLRPLATVSRQAQFSLAALDDGTTAVSLSTPQRRDPKAPWDLGLRVTAPEQDVFGATRNLRTERVVRSGHGAGLEGGRELRVASIDIAVEQVSIARRRADGSFSGPLSLPRVGPGFRSGPLVSLADGTPLAITQAERRTGDCPNAGLGAIGSGPLTAAGRKPSQSTQRLSKPDQMAFNPQAATLADGTVIASWENAASRAGSARVEVAIRPTGSSRFLTSQILPRLSEWWESKLATGGDQAVLAWIVGDSEAGPSRVVMSSLRQAPPYAARARLSKRPQTPCG